MGYLYTFLCTLMFSFIGALSTTATKWVSADVAAFCRFFFGVLFLLVFMGVTKRKISLRLTGFAVWLGVLCKSSSYVLENIAFSRGYSFGGIISWPVQCVSILFFSILFLREKITVRAGVGTALCMLGVGVISWNGQPLTELFQGDGMLCTILMLLSGIGAAGFTMAQRLLVKEMDSCNLNLSIFALSAVLTGVPLPVTATFGEFRLSSLIALILMGVITGAGFLLAAEAMKTLPLFFVTILQSANVFLTLLWSVLFFHEPVTVYVVAGTAVFFAGMILVNWKQRTKKHQPKNA